MNYNQINYKIHKKLSDLAHSSGTTMTKKNNTLEGIIDNIEYKYVKSKYFPEHQMIFIALCEELAAIPLETDGEIYLELYKEILKIYLNDFKKREEVLSDYDILNKYGNKIWKKLLTRRLTHVLSIIQNMCHQIEISNKEKFLIETFSTIEKKDEWIEDLFYQLDIYQNKPECIDIINRIKDMINSYF